MMSNRLCIVQIIKEMDTPRFTYRLEIIDFLWVSESNYSIDSSSVGQRSSQIGRSEATVIFTVQMQKERSSTPEIFSFSFSMVAAFNSLINPFCAAIYFGRNCCLFYLGPWNQIMPSWKKRGGQHARQSMSGWSIEETQVLLCSIYCTCSDCRLGTQT